MFDRPNLQFPLSCSQQPRQIFLSFDLVNLSGLLHVEYNPKSTAVCKTMKQKWTKAEMDLPTMP